MAKRVIPSLTTVPVATPAEPEVMSARPPKPRRESLHVRVAPEVIEGLHQAAFRFRRDKQDLVEEALREWLARQGFGLPAL
jgi:hypothetical protein